MGRFRYLNDHEPEHSFDKEEQEERKSTILSSSDHQTTTNFPWLSGDSLLVATQQNQDHNEQHHHYYYYIAPYNDQQKQSSTFFHYRTWILVVAILAVLIQFIVFYWAIPNFGPPGPPHQSEEGTILSWNQYLQIHQQQLINSTYAIFWETPKHVFYWWWILLKDTVQHRYQHLLQLPTSSSYCSIQIPSNLRDQLQSYIAGQEIAIERITQAIMSWDQQTNLLIVLLGASGTGKRTTAYALVQDILYAECQAELPILVLKQEQLQDRVKTMESIQEYGRKYPESNVIIIENWVSWLSREDFPSKTLVIGMANEVGASTIAKAIRQSALTSPSLMLDLQEQLGPNRVDVVVPFVPLNPSVLRDILQFQVARYSKNESNTRWKDFLLTSAALDRFVDASYVEYFVWYRKDNPSTPISTFSSVGAQVLSETTGPIWTKIKAQVSRCFGTPRLSKTAVLDYKSWQGVLLWCDDDQKNCEAACRFAM